jgi:hypothetical protein
LKRFLFLFFFCTNVFSQTKLIVYFPNNKYLIHSNKENISFKSNDTYFGFKQLNCIKVEFLNYLNLINKIKLYIKETFPKNMKKPMKSFISINLDSDTFYIPDNAIETIQKLKNLEVQAQRLAIYEKISCDN